MESKRSGGRPHANAVVPEDGRRRLAVDAGMLIFLVGLALLFVAGAPS